MKIARLKLLIITLLVFLLTANFTYGDEGDKNFELEKPNLSQPKVIVINSIDDIDKIKVNPGDIVKVDERATKAYSGYTEEDILATYEESGIVFTSYSNTFPTVASLKNFHDELMKNTHYKEYKKLGSVTIYPDGPEYTLGMAISSWYQKAVMINSNVEYIPYEYSGADIEIYQTEYDYHDELSEIIPTLAHEYGHSFTYNYMIEAHHQLPRDVYSDYVKVRGIEGNSNLRSDYSNGHKWSVAEIMAEDYRILFGAENNPSSHENQEIPNLLSEPYYSQVMNFWNETLIKNGNGTSDNPYLISTPYQLSQINYYDEGGKYYKLNNNIDFDNYAADYLNNNGNWFPIESFTGVLDGNDYEVKNLNLVNLLNDSDLSYGDNFGLIRNLSGTVKNLSLTNVYIDGNVYIGAITGRLNSNGTISNCYVSGAINGNDILGGLIGCNEGTIENCLSEVNITGEEYIGGLIGYNNFATASYNLTNATINGYDYVGGIVGYNENGTVSNNVSVNDFMRGSVYSDMGRIVGYDYYNNGVIQNNYALYSMDLGGYSPTSNINGKDGLSKSLQELTIQSTYEQLGWDFVNSWIMVHNNNGYKLPMIKRFTIREEVIYDDGVIKKIAVYYDDIMKYINVYKNDIIQYTEDYDKDGKLIAKYTYQKVGEIYVYHFIHYYKADGEIDYTLEYDNNGVKIARYRYQKNDSGEDVYNFKDVYLIDGTLDYTLQYDTDERIIAKFVYENDELKYKYVYDKYGNLEYKLEYKNNKTIAKYVYYNNDENNLRYKYVYNENIKLIYKEEYKNNILIAKYTYYIDDNGKYRYKYKYVYNTDGSIDYKIEYKEGKMIYKYTYYDNNEDNLKYKYVYDENKNLKHKYMYKQGVVAYKYTYYKNSNGEYKYEYKYYYNATGIRYTKRYSYLDKKTIYVTSDDKEEIKAQYYWSNITFVVDGSYLKVYDDGVIKFKLKYDSYGNIIRKYTYYKDDAKYRYKYIYYYSTAGNLNYSYEYDNGIKIAKYTYYKDANGIYQWKYKYVYNTSGILQYKYEYEAGVKIKKYTYYIDDNGKYRYKYIYYYNSKSELQYKEEYKAGVRIKKYTYYIDSNGKYRYKYIYYYNSEGVIQYKYEYEDGEKIAKYTYYKDSNGKYRYKYKYEYNNNELQAKYEYRSGKIIAKYTYYKDDDGKYRYKYKFVYDSDGFVDYIYEYYNGKKIYKYTYTMDENGYYYLEYKYAYDDNEKLSYKEKYENGTRVLKYTYYKDSEGNYRYEFKYVYDDTESNYWKSYDYINKKWKYYMYYNDTPTFKYNALNVTLEKAYYNIYGDLVVQFWFANGFNDRYISHINEFDFEIYDKNNNEVAYDYDLNVNDLWLNSNEATTVSYIIPSSRVFDDNIDFSNLSVDFYAYYNYYENNYYENNYYKNNYYENKINQSLVKGDNNTVSINGESYNGQINQHHLENVVPSNDSKEAIVGIFDDKKIESHMMKIED